MTVWVTEELKFFLRDDKGVLLRQDVEAWFRWKMGKPARNDEELFEFLEKILASWEFEFRNIVDFRLGQVGWWSVRPNLDQKREQTLWIMSKDIGGGLIVQHGNSTRIYAEKIGKNLWVNQNVTIGDSGKGAPTIGDNVKIHTGAVVVGPIRIGDGVTITANAVVTSDVPDWSTVYAPRSVVVRPSETSTEVQSPAVTNQPTGSAERGHLAATGPANHVSERHPTQKRSSTIVPAFLIARPRSGTTAFRALLDGHPGMAMTLGEVFHELKAEHADYFFHYFSKEVNRNPSLAIPSIPNREKLLAGYLQTLASRFGLDSDKQNILLGINYNSLHVLNHYWQNFYQPPFLIELLKRKQHKVIHLIRRNIFKSLVSEVRAKKMGNWHRIEGQPYQAPPKFELPLEGLAMELEYRDAEIRLITTALADHGECLTLQYEKLFDADGQASPHEMERVQEFLKLKTKIPVRPRFQKTGDEDLEQTISNVDEVRSLLASTRWASMTY